MGSVHKTCSLVTELSCCSVYLTRINMGPTTVMRFTAQLLLLTAYNCVVDQTQTETQNSPGNQADSGNQDSSMEEQSNSNDAFEVGVCKDISEALGTVKPEWVLELSKPNTWSVQVSTVVERDRRIKTIEVHEPDKDGKIKLELKCSYDSDKKKDCRSKVEYVVNGATEKYMMTDSDNDQVADMRYYVLLNKEGSYAYVYKCTTVKELGNQDDREVNARYVLGKLQEPLGENDADEIDSFHESLNEAGAFKKSYSDDVFEVGLCKTDISSTLQSADASWAVTLSKPKTWKLEFTNVLELDKYIKEVKVHTPVGNGKTKLELICGYRTNPKKNCESKEEYIVDGAGAKEMATDSNGDGKADMKYYVLRSNGDQYMFVYKCTTDQALANLDRQLNTRYLLIDKAKGPLVQKDVDDIETLNRKLIKEEEPVETVVDPQ